VVSFFAMPHIISIHEEFEIDPSNPEHADMIKEYEGKTGQKLTGDIESKPVDPLAIVEAPTETPPPEDEGGLTFVDIHSLEKLAEHSKKQFAAKDLLG